MSRVPPTPRGEIAKSVRDTMSRISEPVRTVPQSSAETKALRAELSSLNEQLTSKDEELARYRARNMMVQERQTKKISSQEELESERIALSDLLSSLEDRYSAGEVSIFEYSRLYKKYTKELFLVRKQQEYLS